MSPLPISRSGARDRILQAANLQIARTPYGGYARPLLGSRHLQRAVCIVRRRQLVAANVLTAAGFNVSGEK